MDNFLKTAQEPDGYLNTARTVDPNAVVPDREGLVRWSNLRFNHDPSHGEVVLELNGAPIPLRLESGFARLTRTWGAGDTVTFRLPLRVRRVVSHEAVAENRGRVALERGPLVYCAEAVDHGGAVSALRLPDGAPLTARHDPTLLGGVTRIEGAGLTLVPYYAWSHRGVGEMGV